MKCNKCLTIIPPGEEIRMNWSDSSHSNNYCSKNSYGAAYCETCWKTKSEYRYYEQGGRERENKILWTIFAVIVLLIVGLVYWCWKHPKEEEKEE